MTLKKAFFPILLALSIMVSFSACNGGGDVSSTAENTQINTIEPPEDGWTPELLNSVLYLNGEPFPLPYPVSELKKNKDYEIKDLGYYDDGTASGLLYFQKNYLGTVVITNCKKNSGIQKESKINSIAFNSNSIFKDFHQIMSINSININSDENQIIKYLGKGYSEERKGISNAYEYYYSNTDTRAICIILNNDNPKAVDTIISWSENAK